MADRSTLLLLDALRRAMAEPAGLLLHAGKASPGLFPPTAPGKLAAQRALDQQLLSPLDDDPRRFILSDRGLHWLLHQASPRTVLEDLVRALESRHAESEALAAAADRLQGTLDVLRQRVEQVLDRLPVSPAGEEKDWRNEAVAYLKQRVSSEDCPLPELFEHARRTEAGLTVGGFHDGLRALHEDELIYLHPWTGPLYALPEPACALLIGHEIAYYASPRRNAERGAGNGEHSRTPHSEFRVTP